jgi:acetyltransferase-like isoleucine patch superfamily enzyme
MKKKPSLIHKIIQSFARYYKGSAYSIDAEIPVSALLSTSIRRCAALLRSLLKGAVITLNPRELIFLAPAVELRSRSLIRFGRGITIGRGVIIDGLSKNGISIGDNVTIGQYSIIEGTGVITSIGEGASIGSNSSLGAFSFIGAAGGVRIGSNVIMGQRVSFHSENHNFDSTEIPIREQGVTREGIIIEDDCWVGANVTFLDGVTIGRGSVIAAGAVVRGDIAPYSVAAGVPARVISTRKSK